MSSIEALFRQAHRNHQMGLLDDAENIYKKILHKNHENSEVQYLYGALKIQRGDYKASIAFSKNALKVQPGHAGALSNLGFAYSESGDLERALECYYQAIESEPAHAGAHYNLACLMQSRGQLDEAISHFEKSIEIRPDHYLSYARLADTCLKINEYERALQCFEKARALRPEEAETHHNVSFVLRKLGRLSDALANSLKATELMPEYKLAYNTQGLIYEDLGQDCNAESCYQTALSYDSGFVDALSNLASLYRKSERHDEAIDLLKKAELINPRHTMTLNNLGACYRDLGRLELACEYYHRTLEINPDYFESLSNLAETYYWQGKYESAIELADKITAIHPEKNSIRWNRSFSYLCLGKLKQGWEDYEYRKLIETSTVREFPYPVWDGTSLNGRTLLVHGEQGLGDEILFSSCYTDVIAQANRVIIDCDPRLVTLFERSFPEALIHGGRPDMDSCGINELAAIDCQIAAGSLPRFTRLEIDSFPQRESFLIADPARVKSFSERLKATGEGLKVGIAWRSSKRTATRNHSYTDLCNWMPILSIPGVQFVSLQYDECHDELRAAQDLYGVTIHHWDDLDQFNDLDGVSALVTALDLVICVDISVLAFAGALGVPTWKLSIPNDWTILGQKSNLWYPCMRYFTQNKFGEWSDVISNIATELDILVNGDSKSSQGVLDTGIIAEDKCLMMSEQAGSQKETDTLTLKQCRDGLILFDSTDETAGQSLEQYGEYAANEVSILQQLLQEGNIVLEADAGFGIRTIMFSQLVGTSGLVMAVESRRLLFQRLCANLALNNIENVHACQWNVAGNECHEDTAGQEITDQIPIDGLGITACDLLCINLAGTAMDTINSASETITRFKPFIYIRNVCETERQKIQYYIEGIGYSSLLYEIDLYSPDNFQENTANIFGEEQLRCLLCIPTGH